MDLVQGNLSVQEYTVQFERLSHFAPHLIDAPEKKNKKYVRGLTMSIHGHAMSLITQSFETLVELESNLEIMYGNQRPRQPFGSRPDSRFNPNHRAPNRVSGMKRPWNGTRRPATNPQPQQTIPSQVAGNTTVEACRGVVSRGEGYSSLLGNCLLRLRVGGWFSCSIPGSLHS